MQEEKCSVFDGNSDIIQEGSTVIFDINDQMKINFIKVNKNTCVV